MRCRYLHARTFSGGGFRKGNPKRPYLAQFRKPPPEDKPGSTNMVSSRTSTFSSVFGSGVDTDDVSHWQSLLATFIVDSAFALGHPYFYLLRINTKWSLCLLSGLSPIHYSSLLLECQLVRIRKNPAGGSRQVMFDRTKWIAFLERYELRVAWRQRKGGLFRGHRRFYSSCSRVWGQPMWSLYL